MIDNQQEGRKILSSRHVFLERMDPFKRKGMLSDRWILILKIGSILVFSQRVNNENYPDEATRLRLRGDRALVDAEKKNCVWKAWKVAGLGHV